MVKIIRRSQVLALLIRLNIDWLVIALALLVALYCGSYVMLNWL